MVGLDLTDADPAAAVMQGKRGMELDLCQDVPRLRELLKQAVSSYSRGHNKQATRSKYPPVTRVDLDYTFGMAELPLISIHFDTRSTEPRHDWSHAFIAAFAYLRWNPARLHAEDGGSVSLRTPWGRVEVEGEEEFDRAVGTFFVRLLKEARDAGVFKRLPRAPGCEFGVRSYDGFFGWPVYEERGKENMI